MNLRVPSLEPGARSLPAELRTGAGYNFAQRRMANGMTPAGIGGFSGLGDDGDPDVNDPGSISTTPIVTVDPSNGTCAFGTCDGTSSSPITAEQIVQQALVAQGIDAGSATTIAAYSATPVGYTGPTVVSASAATPAAPAGYNWATLINASGQNLAKILTIAQGGSSVTLPNGTQLLYGSSASAAGASALSSIASATGLSSNVLVLVGVGLVAFMLLGNRK